MQEGMMLVPGYLPTDHIPYCMTTVTSKKKLYMKIKNPWHKQLPVPFLPYWQSCKLRKETAFKTQIRIQMYNVYIKKHFFSSKLGNIKWLPENGSFAESIPANKAVPSTIGCTQENKNYWVINKKMTSVPDPDPDPFVLGLPDPYPDPYQYVTDPEH